MNTAAREAVHTVLRRFGFDVTRHDPNRIPPLRRARLLAQRRITLVLDVGANAGQYAEQLREVGYRNRIVSFEPLSDAYRELERRAAADPAWEARHVALGEQAGTARINVAGNSYSSSLLPMTDRHVEGAPESLYVGTEEVEVARLDELAPAILRPADRVWLKLDTQGFELQVLLGAARTLETVDVVDVELSLLPLYDGQALLSDVVTHLSESGFGLHWLDAGFADYNTGELLQVDGLFIRRAANGDDAG